MTAEEIRKWWQARPFVPFDLVLANGETWHVPQPEFLSVSPRGRTVRIWAVDDHTISAPMAAIRAVKSAAGSSARRRHLQKEAAIRHLARRGNRGCSRIISGLASSRALAKFSAQRLRRELSRKKFSTSQTLRLARRIR